MAAAHLPVQCKVVITLASSDELLESPVISLDKPLPSDSLQVRPTGVKETSDNTCTNVHTHSSIHNQHKYMQKHTYILNRQMYTRVGCRNFGRRGAGHTLLESGRWSPKGCGCGREYASARSAGSF